MGFIRDRWVQVLRAADIVAAPINTLLEASNDSDVLANNYIAMVDYPEYGKTAKVHGSPWKFSKTPAQIGIAPKLGADSESLLRGLGYSETQVTLLRKDGVI